MKYYFMSIDGIYINGYTQSKFTDDEGNLLEGYIEIENPSQDLLENFIFYKIVEGELVKMPDEEFKALYPNYGIVVPTDIEKLQQENHLLKAQVKALTDRGEFQDELIAEIATVVYV